MNKIDQNRAIISSEQALIPGPSLIDGRTEQDWLCFLSEFGSLINFYDNNNTVNSNWTPFLLKDPVFLLAEIAKTKFYEIHSLYRNTCAKLEQLINLKRHVHDTHISFNELFDQLIRVFMLLKRWIYFMQRSGEEYDLKTWMIHQVKTNYSKYYWALISLRQNMFVSFATKEIELAAAPRFHLFEPYEEIIWKQDKDKSPYWEILGLRHPVAENTSADFFNALAKAGDNLFNFFQTIIRHSTTEFEKLKAKKSKYPDTTLLRAFVNLLKTHQDQLNGISHKHLHFYYKDILKQAALPAIADNVFICAQLAKKDTTFNLPAGTLFDAGIDAQKNPVLFTTKEDLSLNPANVINAYTLSALPGPGNLSSLYLQNISTPGVLQKDQEGKIQTWETFGSSIPSPAALTKLGIAVASPMLLLREGQRNISLNLEFAANIDQQLLQKGRYYLSTQKEWLDITSFVSFFLNISGAQNMATVEIALSPAQPPIEAFLKNPDGLNSSWPLMKMEFSLFPDLSAPPVLKQLEIETKVSNIKTFQLYNDYGALSTKTPFQPMGPLPLVNSSFIIGNNEIFSKPLDSLYVEMDWSNQPDDFSLYYQQYNNYLTGKEPAQNTGRPSAWQRFKLCVSHLFGYNPPPAPISEIPFSNVCFTVDFNMLQNNSWEKLNMTKRQNITISPANDIVANPYQNDTGCVPPAGAGNLLFSTTTTDDSKCVVTASSYFGYNAAGPVPASFADPGIQNTPLKFTDASTSGFMNMVLSGPPYGFGSELYPNVVSYIALQNALNISKSNGKDAPALIQPAKLPFAPKLANLTAHYTASQTYHLTEATGTYPVQFFLYTPFASFLAYDNTKDPGEYNNGYITSITGTEKATPGIPLFASFEYSGAFFLEMQNVIPSNSIQLYFELARNYGVSSTNKTIEYYYLGNTGWKQLPVLSESTNGFSCSGIIKPGIPADITNENPVMPGNNYWISVAVKNSPALFAQTAFLKTNGFVVQRTGTSFLASTVTPKIPASTITKPQIAIPQIAAIIQPFPSFGGKSAENHMAMHQRVSNRIKTKDRAISNEDYFRLIRQEYKDIFYAKPVFDPITNSTKIYLVKRYESYKDPNAFTPLISECKQETIQTFLTQRTSVFSNINVSNFDFQLVQVTANIFVKTGFECQGVQKKIIHALNIFLSPWISSNKSQIMIDAAITGAQVAEFISSTEGVAGVQSVFFQTWIIDKQNGQKKIIGSNESTIIPSTESTLFVSCMDHVIECNATK
jgi:hypothetical protein